MRLALTKFLRSGSLLVFILRVCTLLLQVLLLLVVGSGRLLADDVFENGFSLRVHTSLEDAALLRWDIEVGRPVEWVSLQLLEAGERLLDFVGELLGARVDRIAGDVEVGALLERLARVLDVGEVTDLVAVDPKLLEKVGL